jgi:serine/threonine protein kinase/Tol biopolymer transport system component
MTLTNGTRLGPYEILAPLGAGGMGEVYRARDTRLDRTVAIKVLPSHLASNSEVRQRFEREARAISSLSHPYICTLHDVGHQDGTDYLVMEFIEGETLADRLSKGALPTDQVLRYGIQISDALDKAHRAGIVHRDLKPGNIMLTKVGAKLLDFGLAKLHGGGYAIASSLTSLPTERHSITGEGAIMGTFQYMSPEQLEGREVDARTDIFAFGGVAYEMATGKRAFTGRSQASLIGAILKDNPPPISTIQPMAPPALDRVVRKCLAKDPDERWQSAHDLMDELRWIAEGGSVAGIPPTVGVERKKRERIAWLALTVLLFVAALILGIAYYLRTPVEVRAVRSFILPPEKSSFNFGRSGVSITLSPDGTRLAFVAPTAEGRSLLWVRSLDGLSAQALAGTEAAAYPFWSADSRSLGFFAHGKLKRIDAAGGSPLSLCDAPQGRGGTWNRDGVIVFSPNPSSALQRVSALGGASSPVTRLDETSGQLAHRWPTFLPDGDHFLYLGGGNTIGTGEGTAVYASSLESKESKLLLRANSNVEYAQGYLLYLRGTTLMAQRFDARRLELVGEALPLVEQVQDTLRSPTVGVFSVSENGLLAYQMSRSAGSSQLTWFDRSGVQLGVLGDQALYSNPRLSPDRKMASVGIIDSQSGRPDIWVYEVARARRTRFTFDQAEERIAVWSPDGSHIAFSSNRKGHFDIYQKASSGAGSDELLLESDFDKQPTSWSRDGRFLLYWTFDPKTQADIWVLPLAGDRKPFPFLNTEFNEGNGQFSPDGRWIAYFSAESDRVELYVAPFPGPGGKRQISTSGATVPAKWRGDGKEIFYLALDNKLMAAEVDGTGSMLEVGAVRALFEIRVGGPAYVYDATADGQRFLVNTAVEQKESAPITLVINWTADLKR